MHIPVLLCGFVCGAKYGAAVGATAPILRFAMFGKPLFWSALPMSFELCAYGLFAGLLYSLLPKKALYTYVSLICAMLSGRAVWGIAQTVLLGFSGKSLAFSAFIASAFLNAIPGIILQLILIPAVMLSLQKFKPSLLD